MRALPQSSIYIGDAPETLRWRIAPCAGHRRDRRSAVPQRLRAAAPDALIETIRELPALLKEFLTKMKLIDSSSTDFSLWILGIVKRIENPNAEHAAEKLAACHSEGRVCPRNLAVSCKPIRKADPSLRSDDKNTFSAAREACAI